MWAGWVAAPRLKGGGEVLRPPGRLRSALVEESEVSRIAVEAGVHPATHLPDICPLPRLWSPPLAPQPSGGGSLGC